MPAALSYPGVYVEEIPSGVRTITGVATSIGVFVGWAPKGPVDQAELVLSFADYERKLGGLDMRSNMSYAVYQFFQNGGQQAYAMRLVSIEETKKAKTSSTTIGTTPGTTITVNAANPGKWGDNYGVKLMKRTDKPERFRMEVVYKTDTTVEVFENMSISSTDSRFAETVINNESSLIRIKIVLPSGATPPTPPDDVTATQDLLEGDDGTPLTPADSSFDTQLTSIAQEGALLDRIDLFNLLCVPGETNNTTISALQAFCQKRRAMLIVDCKNEAKYEDFNNNAPDPLNNLTGASAINAAYYFPWVNAPDPCQENKSRAFPPCGFIAGLYASTDAQRGVWKAPAGVDASLVGISGLQYVLTDRENGVLNKKGINCLRTFPVYNSVVWGARTLRGNDEIGSEWKYIPVRRTALFIEESLYRGLKWVVFEPNDEPLWSQIRLNVGAFMHNLFRQGAFQGSSPKDAYFVKCDKETTTQNDINLGIVNVVVGFAPLKPAEFVVIKLQQIAGQIQV